MNRYFFIVGIVVFVVLGVAFFWTSSHAKVETALAKVSLTLRELSLPEPESASVVTERVRAYKDAVASLVREVGDIGDVEQRNNLSAQAMRRLAGDQQILRALRHLPPNEPTEAIDEARYANIEAQEKIVQDVEKRDTSRPADVNESLACPGCNIVFVVLTTLRKDRIGLYGNEKGITPNIDTFFSSAIRFTDVLSPSSWTIPDAVTLFTSLFPYGHGVAYREPPSIPAVYNSRITTLAQELSRAGYATAGFTGGGDYSRVWSGLDRGFDLYLDDVTFSEFGIAGDSTLGGVKLQYAPLRDFIGLATGWLKKHEKEKFFLLVQGYDTHCPLEPREPYASRFTKDLSSSADFSVCHWRFGGAMPTDEESPDQWITTTVRQSDETRIISSQNVTLSANDVAYMRGLYDARVAEVDDRLTALFETLEKPAFAENTIVVFMSEHGDTLGEHGSFMRGAAIRGTPLEGALSTPLLIKHPKVKDPIVVTDLVQLADIMPTVLAMLRVGDSQEALREGSVLRLSALGETPTNEYTYSGAQYLPLVGNPYFSRATLSEIVRHEDWKLVREVIFKEEGYDRDSVSYKLFNIHDDPEENLDLSAAEPKVLERLVEKLDEWSARYFSSL
jgi:arylsulfatase A-like enzyme